MNNEERDVNILEIIPDEIIGKIMEDLPIIDFMRSREISRFFKNIVDDNIFENRNEFLTYSIGDDYQRYYVNKSDLKYLDDKSLYRIFGQYKFVDNKPYNFVTRNSLPITDEKFTAMKKIFDGIHIYSSSYKIMALCWNKTFKISLNNIKYKITIESDSIKITLFNKNSSLNPKDLLFKNITQKINPDGSFTFEIKFDQFNYKNCGFYFYHKNPKYNYSLIYFFDLDNLYILKIDPIDKHVILEQKNKYLPSRNRRFYQIEQRIMMISFDHNSLINDIRILCEGKLSEKKKMLVNLMFI